MDTSDGTNVVNTSPATVWNFTVGARGALTNPYIGLPPANARTDGHGNYSKSAIQCAGSSPDRHFVALYVYPQLETPAGPTVTSRYATIAPLMKQALYNASGYLDDQADLNAAGDPVRNAVKKLRILCNNGEPDIKDVPLSLAPAVPQPWPAGVPAVTPDASNDSMETRSGHTDTTRHP